MLDALISYFYFSQALEEDSWEKMFRSQKKASTEN